MAGLLKQAPDLPKGKITPQSVREQMHVTPQQGQQLRITERAGAACEQFFAGAGVLGEVFDGHGVQLSTIEASLSGLL